MNLTISRIDTRHQDIASALAKLREKLSPRGNIVSEAGRKKTLEVFGKELSPSEVVDCICQRVRNEGISAVLDFTQKLDGATLTPQTIRVSADELQAARTQVSPDFIQTIERVKKNIWDFQTAILHTNKIVERPGVKLQQRYWPLQRIACCVPGGAAAYPSTVLMTAVPAMAAGVKEIVVVAPPTKFGANNSHVLATCAQLGITEVYRLGGAQAVAALAYGLEGLPKVDKIVGPGNLFVTLAKKYVYGEVDIDSLAGPSEVVVLADGTTPASFTAADLLAQAEHSPGSAVLVTWNDNFLHEVHKELEIQAAKLSRAELTLHSLREFGCFILVSDAAEACQVTNLLAPEHLHIATEEPAALLPHIHTAGATFLGSYSPVALGDYAAGPSHVLPTGGTARWASGLNANSFLRSSSVIEYSAEALRDIAPAIETLAETEGLTAHAASVAIRLNANDKA
jgi:histidinol dehydrogenase